MGKQYLAAVLMVAVLVFSGAVLNRNMKNIGDRKTDRLNDAEENPQNNEQPVFEDINALIAIDPGHGGIDDGSSFDGVVEKEVNLDIALRLERLLNEAGVDTVMTRRDDSLIELRERAKIANVAGAHLFISIHANSLPGYPRFGGTETLYAAPDNPIPSKIDSKRLAELVQQEVTRHLGTDDLGLKYRPELAVLHRTNMPSVIVEIAFLSNIKERELLSKAEYREKAASALRDAVLKALEEDGAFKNKGGQWIYRKQR